MLTFAPRNSKLWLAATSLISAAGIGVLCGFEVETSPAFPAAVQETEFVKFDSEGNLLRPEGYREWVPFRRLNSRNATHQAPASNTKATPRTM